MPLKIVTGNPGKAEEFARMLPGLERLDLDLPEVQELDPHIIVREKLKEALKYDPGPLIVEDTSLCLECLGGLPGPLIKWFKQAIGIDGIARIAEQMGDDRAMARTIVGYGAAGTIKIFEGVVRGRIVAPRGDGFGWDAIFLPDGHDRTFGELSRTEKDAISMRSIAIAKLKAYLDKETRDQP